MESSNGKEPTRPVEVRSDQGIYILMQEAGSDVRKYQIDLVIEQPGDHGNWDWLILFDVNDTFSNPSLNQLISFVESIVKTSISD